MIEGVCVAGPTVCSCCSVVTPPDGILAGLLHLFLFDGVVPPHIGSTMGCHKSVVHCNVGQGLNTQLNSEKSQVLGNKHVGTPAEPAMSTQVIYFHWCSKLESKRLLLRGTKTLFSLLAQK